MRPARAESQCPTSVKVDLVLRLLGGETLGDLARETGRPRRQLSVWRGRFLEGGEAYLEGRGQERQELAELREVNSELSAQLTALSAQLTELKSENRTLTRRAALAADAPGAMAPHPYCSPAYARASEEPGVQLLRVPEWGTHVLVREGRGARQATGVRPLASLDPACDVRAGLDALRRAGVASVSLITDPMWTPQVARLQEGFDTCRTFREHYLVDRDTDLRFHKRHRSRIGEARRVGSVEEVSLAEQLGRWGALYERNVANRGISQPFGSAYFEQIATLPELRTIAVVVAREIVTMTLWIPHGDTLYFHDGASSVEGFEASATYAAFAHAIEHAVDYRYVFLGGSSSFRDNPLEGLAMFKRGFSNATAVSYLCSARLSAQARAAP